MGASTGWKTSESRAGMAYKSFSSFKASRQDKGHASGIAASIERVANGGEAPISFDELENATRASLAVVDAARERRTIILQARVKAGGSGWPRERPL